MESLMKLEEAMLSDNQKGVESYLSEIDLKTANDMMRRAGEALGFPTMDANGITWGHMGMLSRIFGYAGVSSLAYFVDTYHLQTSKIGWFPVELKTRAREIFNLDPKDSQATFVTWDTFLVAGMQGQSEEAKKVKLYLLKMETCARVAVATSPEHLRYESHRIKVLREQINLAAKVSSMKEGPLREAATEALEQLLGKKLPEPAQMKLIK